MTDIVPIPDPDDALALVGQLANQAASSSVFRDYLERRAHETLRRQLADLRLFSEYLAQMNIEREPKAMLSQPVAWQGMSWGLVEGFKRYMVQQGYSVGSVNARLSTVKVFARLAFRAGAILSEEYAQIQTVAGYSRKDALRLDEKRAVTRRGHKKAAAVPISRMQARALKHQPLASPQGCRDALLMCLLLDHGLRASEVADLEASAINLKTGQMTFFRRKVSKTQTHTLTPDTFRAARAWMEGGHVGAAGPLLRASHKSGSLTTFGMTTRAITERVRLLGEALGIEGLSAHDCRHYWATHAARSGTDPFALQEAGGWSSLSMPRRYVEEAQIANAGIRGFEDEEGD